MQENDDLLIRFKSTAKQIYAFQREGSMAGIKKANKLYPVLSNIFVQIKAEGKSHELVNLLDDDDDGVKLQVAWRLLQFPDSYDKAKAVLLALVKSKEVHPLYISFSAENALKNFENGTLSKDL